MPSPDLTTSRWHIRVRPASSALDGHGRDVLADIRQTGLTHIEGVRSSKVYLLEGRLSEADVSMIGSELLTDPVAEAYEAGPGFAKRADTQPAIEVHVQPGVMSPVSISTTGAVRRLLRARGGQGSRIDEVQVARRYEIVGARSADELDTIARRALANGCIETWFIQGLGRLDTLPDRFPSPPERPFSLQSVPIRGLDDAALGRLSREGHLFLSLEEMRAIRDYYDRMEREPTDLELETLAQTWSEHCVHKTLKSEYLYRGAGFPQMGPFGNGLAESGGNESAQIELRFKNLLKETIVAATRELNRDWCLSVFVDNAGVIAFDDEYGVAFKVETHNHPSAIEPYGGSATGVGGCIRDVMGCGLGAKPVASTDVFCLAAPDFESNRLPKDVLHPRRVLKGVVSGVRDYGNRMGIPTVNGAIYFDDRYLANPLVFCGCVGLIPRNRIEKAARPGDHIVVAGGRTGRDGIHGATFSSAELTDTHADEFAHAVQIGNAIEEKKVLDALLIARDHEGGCLYSAVTDCGAGGLSSAVGEMGAELGATVDLEKVPLKYAGLRYDEIWISEAQERMVFAVPPDRLDAFLAVFAAEDVEATVIGEFRNDRRLHVRFRGQIVGELDMAFLHEGIPQSVRRATWTAKAKKTPATNGVCGQGLRPATKPSRDRLLTALRSLNVASKEWVIRQYDHEVQSRSVIKPLAGPGAGPSDAAVIRPRIDSHRAIALACGLCPHWAEDDPYWMAIAAVDEALRNVICVGANPDRIAILDNFCWPKVDSEESLGALVRTCMGASAAARCYGLPFISGKDSLNNEFVMSEADAARTGLPKRLAIPYTLLVSAIGIVDDARQCVSMDLKRSGNVLALASSPVTTTGLESARDLHRKVAALSAAGKLRSAHDVSDGGLAVAIAEMCIAGELGAEITLTNDVYPFDFLTEVPTTYLMEMTQQDAMAAGLPIVGRVTEEPILQLNEGSGDAVSVLVSELAVAWRTGLSSRAGV